MKIGGKLDTADFAVSSFFYISFLYLILIIALLITGRQSEVSTCNIRCTSHPENLEVDIFYQKLAFQVRNTTFLYFTEKFDNSSKSVVFIIYFDGNIFLLNLSFYDRAQLRVKIVWNQIHVLFSLSP